MDEQLDWTNKEPFGIYDGRRIEGRYGDGRVLVGTLKIYDWVFDDEAEDEFPAWEVLLDDGSSTSFYDLAAWRTLPIDRHQTIASTAEKLTP